MSKQCKCGKGYASHYDDKCDNCRSKKERIAHRRSVDIVWNYQIAVVNKHHRKSGEYIGRGSPLGNPFVIGKHGTREEVIAKYAIWLKEQIDAQNPTVLDELNRLGNKAIDGKGLSLQCFCHPKPCHGEVIKERLIKAIYTYFKDNK